MHLHRDTIRFGIHSGQQYGSFDEALALWRTAESLGADWVSVFDHFRPMDRPLGPCLEGPTLLAALAARTPRVRCAILVAGVPYRHPGILASIAATLDHVSGGRLELGLGAGGPDLAQQQFGLPFPPVGERMDMLEETCTVLRRLWTEESVTFRGRHFQLEDARLEPRPLQSRVPIVIGGGGEQRTLRIAARHADVWNTVPASPDGYRHKLDVLRGHCADLGRDPAEIRKSILFRAVLAPTETEAYARLDEMTGHAPADSPLRQGWLVVGTPEQCLDRLIPYAEMGVRDFLLGARAPVDWETVELAAGPVAEGLRRWGLRR